MYSLNDVRVWSLQIMDIFYEVRDIKVKWSYNDRKLGTEIDAAIEIDQHIKR